MKTIFVALIGSIILLTSGCENTDTNDLEKKMATIEMKIDTMLSQNAKGWFKADANKDGKITRTEYNSWFREIFNIELKGLDSNGDRSISKKELTATGKNLSLFGTYDKDNNGLVTESEFITFFDDRFNTADRNSDEKISIEDTGLIDKNNNGNIDINEYREAVNEFFAELTSEKAVKGYGYGNTGNYMRCDPSGVRCIALYIRGFSRAPWGGDTEMSPHEDPCDKVNCTDPWPPEDGPPFDPMNPCCD